MKGICGAYDACVYRGFQNNVPIQLELVSEHIYTTGISKHDIHHDTFVM